MAIVKMCYEAKDWDALNENIILLSKRRSQLKQVNKIVFGATSYISDSSLCAETSDFPAPARVHCN